MDTEFLIQPLNWLTSQFINTNKRVFIGYLFTAVLFAWFCFYRMEKTKRLTFIQFILPKSVWLHSSAKLDYVVWIINALIKTLVILPVIFASAPIAIWISSGLEDVFGELINPIQNKLSIMIWFTLIIFILDDFTRFLLHWLMHKVPILWHLHKVHHSANVLTPITVYRTHPIESLLYTCRLLLTHGIAIGIGFYLFGHKLAVIDIAGANIGVFVFNIMAANLRHSHIWLSWGDKLEKWFISPAQHQIHHSTNPMHFDTNLGSALAIWDRAFGTLIMASTISKKIQFGLGIDDRSHYSSLLSLYFTPLRSIAVDFINVIKNANRNVRSRFKLNS